MRFILIVIAKVVAIAILAFILTVRLKKAAAAGGFPRID